MIGQHTLDTQEIEHLQNIVLNSQQVFKPPITCTYLYQSPSQNHSADNRSSSVPLDNAQRPPSSGHYQALHLSQLRMSESGESQSEQFQFLGGDSFPYHRHRLGIESQVDDISPSPSLSEYHPQLTSISYPPQGGDGTPFKVPSFPSISSIIRNSRSSDENGSSVQTAGEASPRLSQFFHPTQESPPQLHSSPHHLPLLPDSIPHVAPPDPSPIPPPRAYTPIAVLEARERARAEEAAAAEEARRRAEEDSFTTVPEHLRRRWAMEEKAHKMFEGLRNVKIDLKSGRGVGNDSQIDDFMFGTKSRVDPDGVRRVIKPEPKKTVSETGLESDGEGEGEGEGARKRASTAPVREKKGSTSTVISNSQRSNPSNGDTNGTVVKETPLESTPVSRPVTADAGGALDSSQLIDIFEQQGDLVTPARTTTNKNIPSSIPSSSRRVMETPAVKHLPTDHHHDESVPETSPVKEIEGTESQEYRTARSSFPQEIDSSPVVVPGRPRAKNGFVASSIPNDMTQRKRGRAPVIQDDVSEEEEDEHPPPPAISPPPRKRRRVKSTELVETTTNHVVSPSVTSFDNGMETHRVFARFKDHKNNFFPATVVEPPVAPPDAQVPLETAVLVRFDDDMETMVELRHIRRLHLIEGITVKLAIPEYNKRIYIVQRVEYDPKETGKPDINNDNIVYVTPKKGTDEIRVPIAKVFVTGQLFAQFKEPYLFTSTSRTKYPGLISRQVSSSPRIVRGAKTSLFQNMVFAISLVQPRKSTSAATSKETLTQTIVANCGYVVDEGGLQEIFHGPEDVEGQLVLQPDFADTTFCAVIADGYSRRTKYLQALALGIPCLASRWIESCIQKVTLPPPNFPLYC